MTRRKIEVTEDWFKSLKRKSRNKIKVTVYKNGKSLKSK